MFATDHAATALLLKRRYPSVPITPLLLSVQAMEIAWSCSTTWGSRPTTTEPAVREGVADIHLAWMPYSHSVLTALGAAVLAWLIVELGTGQRALGRAVELGIASHLVLDLLTHAHDIVLRPGSISPQLGLGLYDAAPMGAFIVEMVYGLVCWWIYRGGRGLLALVVLGNLANLSLFSAAIRGPEAFLAGRPLMVGVSLVALQIVVTLALTGVLSARVSPSCPGGSCLFARMCDRGQVLLPSVPTTTGYPHASSILTARHAGRGSVGLQRRVPEQPRRHYRPRRRHLHQPQYYCGI